MYYSRTLRHMDIEAYKTLCFHLFHEYYRNWLAYFPTSALCIVCLRIYMCTYTHTHRHTHSPAYICLCVYIFKDSVVFQFIY